MHFLFSTFLRKVSGFVPKVINRTIKCLLNHESIKQYLKALETNKTLLISDQQHLFELVNRKGGYVRELNALESMNENDKDFIKLIEDEKEEFKRLIAEIDEEILKSHVPNEVNRDVTLEITAGVGGKEAMHFAQNLFEMYINYCSYKGWECEVQETDIPESGGIRHASAFISGREASSFLEQESGVHRVQRVPATEKSGRVHTSTVTVAVLSQPTDIEVVIDDKDLKIETKRSSGAGGQHVNKTESCVRIVHLPTGIAVENQTDRSQIRNKIMAMQRLRAKLYQIELEGFQKQTASSRKEQVGNSMRSEKIRTYNYNQDRVTDHRISANLHNLHGFLTGGKDLDFLITKLVKNSREQQLLQIIEKKLKLLK